MIVLEAAGYDVVLVETVGVGQSEVTVAGMVDTFLFLTLARTGDQLQGIKKGILEIADVIAVNKADGDRADEARSAAASCPARCGWSTAARRAGSPPVLTCSGLEGTGVDEVWAQVLAHRSGLGADGLASKRAGQQLEFTWTLVRDELQQRLRRSSSVKRDPRGGPRRRAGRGAPSDACRRPDPRGVRRGLSRSRASAASAHLLSCRGRSARADPHNHAFAGFPGSPRRHTRPPTSPPQ